MDNYIVEFVKFLAQGKFDNAIKLMEAKSKEGSVRRAYMHSKVLEAKGQIQQSLELLENYLNKSSPDEALIYNYMDICFRQDEYEKLTNFIEEFETDTKSFFLEDIYINSKIYQSYIAFENKEYSKALKKIENIPDAFRVDKSHIQNVGELKSAIKKSLG